MVRNRLFACWLVALGLVASACGALTPDDPAATLQSQREGLIAEATSIAQAAQVQGTQIVGTALAAQTYVAQMEGRNRLLVATMQIAFPPTQAIIDNSGPSTPGQIASPAPVGEFGDAIVAPTQGASGASLTGSVQFTQVQTASSVREFDGCADSLTTTFPADVQQIYITARALNIQAGTAMSVEWYYEGQLSYSESFTVDSSDDDFCLWFFLAPSDVTLSPGNWSVRLFADAQPVNPPQVDFTVG